MKFLKAEHVSCYICGGSKDVKFLYFEPKDDFGPIHSHLQEVGICKNCRKELIEATRNTDKKE